MDTIAGRIIDVCAKCADGNMSAFARKIGVTPAYISKLKNEPYRLPSGRTISDICRVFSVDEVWLRTGVGEMFTPKSRVEELTVIFGDAREGVTDKDRFLRAMASQPDEAFPALVQLIKSVAEELQGK